MNTLAINHIPTKVNIEVLTKKNKSITPKYHNQMVTFKGIEKYNDEQINQMTESKNFILDSVSKIFEKDREIINNHFLGEISEQNKFSKLGYYLSLKENDVVLAEYLESRNLRQLSKEYDNFYNSKLKSYPKVVNNEKKYLSGLSITNENLDNILETELDKYFTNKMSETSSKQKDGSHLNDLYIQKRLNDFTLLFRENPLFIPKDKIKIIFDVIDNQLDTVNKQKYNEIYENLNNLSEALYTKDKALMTDSWKSIKDSTVDFYKNEYLKAVFDDKNSKVQKLENFVNSPTYQILNQNNKLVLLFEYRGSGELTLSEKTFLIEKLNQANNDKKSYGMDMLDFLVNKPANNKIRKQIVKNLVESQEFANDNFNDLKRIFVEDINRKNHDSNIFQQTINRMNIVDLVLEDMNIEHMFMSEKNKVDYLSTIADEDIAKSLEKLRKSWLEEKFVQTLNFESDKYDMSKQTDMLISALTVNHNGENIPINEFLEDMFKTVYGKNADLKQISDNILEFEKANNKNLQGLFIQNKSQYDAVMSQLESVIKTLAKNNASSEAYLMKISKELDRLEMNCPWLKPQVKDTRSTLAKIKDGLFNPSSVMSMMYLPSALQNIPLTGEMNFDTIILSLRACALIYNIFNNTNRQFRGN